MKLKLLRLKKTRNLRSVPNYVKISAIVAGAGQRPKAREGRGKKFQGGGQLPPLPTPPPKRQP